MAEPVSIAEQAERIRSAGALGRSDLLVRLFDYLAQASTAGARPKEVEIALAVFRRDSAFDGAQDASVRVAMHRLRKKLDEFYAGPGRAEPLRLAIPKGEYRLVAQPQVAAPAAAKPARRWPWILAALLAALNMAVLALVWREAVADPLGAVRRQEPWAGLLKSERPLIVVVGDYYIAGEVDEGGGVGRLVRDYGINSHEDLEALRLDDPQAAARLRDLDLYYLPVSVAHALRSVVPVVSQGRGEPRVVMASDLTSDLLRDSDIVYLGYLSGLGALREPLFGASRFAVGDTWDELLDRRSGLAYVSQEGGPSRGAGARRDYGLVAGFPGPQGGRILVIAGMRDVGLMQAAEAAVRPDALAEIRRAAGRAPAFEALFEAEGVRRANIAGRLVTASPIAAGAAWRGSRRGLAFPAG